MSNWLQKKYSDTFFDEEMNQHNALKIFSIWMFQEECIDLAGHLIRLISLINS